MRKAAKTPPEAGDEITWSTPLGAHPSAVIRHTHLDKWIRMTYAGLDPDSYSGHVFLYNISLETFDPLGFRRIWVPNYGEETNPSGRNFFHSIHLILPWHQNPPRMAEWLDCNHIYKLVHQLEQAKSWGDNWRVRSVMEKTWVSFVLAPEEGDLPREDDPFAEYAIALYFALSLPRPNENERERNEADLREKLDNIMDAEHIPNRIVNATRVAIGAGIAEPFSTRVNGYYNYNLLLSFAARHHYKPTEPRNCVMRQHIKVLAKLWQNRSAFPQTGDGPHRCAFIERSPELHAGREIRLDAFFQWALHALKPRRRGLRQTWVLQDKIPPIPLEKRARVSFCSRYPAWQAQFDRLTITQDLLNKGVISLGRYDLFTGRLYCRRARVYKKLKANLVNSIELILSEDPTLAERVAENRKRKKRKNKTIPEHSLFFITAAQGAGKTVLKKRLLSHLRQKAKNNELRKFRFKEVDHTRPARIIPDLCAAVKEWRKKTDTTIIILDEAQKCKDFSSFANAHYNDFDIEKHADAPIVGLFLTSKFGDDDKQLRQWLEEDLGCRRDFMRRTACLGLPAWNAEDQILVLGAKILRAFRLRSYQIQKKALEFLIVDQPYAGDQLLLYVLNCIRESGDSDPLTIEDLVETGYEFQEAMDRHRERIADFRRRGEKYPWTDDENFRFTR